MLTAKILSAIALRLPSGGIAGISPMAPEATIFLIRDDPWLDSALNRFPAPRDQGFRPAATLAQNVFPGG